MMGNARAGNGASEGWGSGTKKQKRKAATLQPQPQHYLVTLAGKTVRLSGGVGEKDMLSTENNDVRALNCYDAGRAWMANDPEREHCYSEAFHSNSQQRRRRSGKYDKEQGSFSRNEPREVSVNCFSHVDASVLLKTHMLRFSEERKRRQAMAKERRAAAASKLRSRGVVFVPVPASSSGK